MSDPRVTVKYNFSSPDEDYSDKSSELNFEKAGELGKDSFDIPDFVKDIGKGEALAIGTGRGLNKTYRGIKDLMLKARNLLGTTSDEQYGKFKQEGADLDKMWDQGLGNKLAPNSGWGKGGETVGQIIPGLVIPGGGQTMLGRAGLQALYNGLFEAATTEGGAGDRAGAGVLGALGAGAGSLGIDTVVKGGSALAGRWGDELAQLFDIKAGEKGLRPTIGELKAKVQRSLSPEDLAKSKPNNAAAIENSVQNTPGARHRTDVEARKLKRELGITDDISTSVALPKVDADNLNKLVTERSNEIWKPFNSATKKIKPGKDGQVYPLELWNSLQDLAKHNSKILNDSSAIPDDVVRGQLNDLLSITNPNQLKRVPAAQYSKIISELSNAQHRTSILSGGQTPTYDAASVARITDAFAKAKNDMAMWGKKNPSAYSAWETALKGHQDEIVPVRGNPVFTTASNLNKHGRDVTKLANKVTDNSSALQVQDLIAQYKKFGLDDAADRLTNMDTLRHATNVLGGTPGDGSTHLISSLGLPFEKATRKPWAKGLYFGDASIQAPTKMALDKLGGKSFMDVAGSTTLGALDQIRRQAPLGYSREHGEDTAVLGALLKDLFGGDGSEVFNEQDPQYSHGFGAATQAGAAGR